MLRESGYICAITEHWNHFAKIRQDLFGCIDIVALGPKAIVGVQTCIGAHHAQRRTKILGLPAAVSWLEAGAQLWIISWSERGARDERKRWLPRIDILTPADFTTKEIKP